jgi:hypothetical protein
MQSLKHFYEKWDAMDISELHEELESLIDKADQLPEQSRTIIENIVFVVESLELYIRKREIEEKLKKKDEKST